MRRITTIIFLFLALATARAQDLSVVSLERAPMDKSATTFPVYDFNDVLCALIKVTCPLPDVKFGGNVLGTPTLKDGQYWVYVTGGTKKLGIQQSLVHPLYIDMTEFLGSGVKSGETYRMTVNIPDNLRQSLSTSNSASTTADSETELPSVEILQSINTGITVFDNLIHNMVFVEGGTFMMGATKEQGGDAEKNEKPAHQVTLSNYYIGKYEVTNEEWALVMGVTNDKVRNHPKRPVILSFDDAQKFIGKLNELTGLAFRLPTEAEFEFAARGGNRSCGYKYAGSNNPNDITTLYDKNDFKTFELQNVGQKMPNELGLYDMSGNASEWCQDWYGAYRPSPQTNPKGSSVETAEGHVQRGGYFVHVNKNLRVSFRNEFHADAAGVRLAM